MLFMWGVFIFSQEVKITERFGNRTGHEPHSLCCEWRWGCIPAAYVRCKQPLAGFWPNVPAKIALPFCTIVIATWTHFPLITKGKMSLVISAAQREGVCIGHLPYTQVCICHALYLCVSVSVYLSVRCVHVSACVYLCFMCLFYVSHVSFLPVSLCTVFVYLCVCCVFWLLDHMWQCLGTTPEGTEDPMRCWDGIRLTTCCVSAILASLTPSICCLLLSVLPTLR